VPRIILDYDPALPNNPQLEGDTSDLVFFLSWAFSARYGGNHEMSLAALILRGEFKIDTVPLLTFADRNIEEPSDEETLERAWQDAAPLAECCRRVAEAFASDEKRLSALNAEYPALRGLILSLGERAQAAADLGARIRVTYLLEDEA
jgi:hypothetical protein